MPYRSPPRDLPPQVAPHNSALAAQCISFCWPTLLLAALRGRYLNNCEPAGFRKLSKKQKRKGMTMQIPKKQGFAAICRERHQEIAAMGGRAVAAEKRSFSQDKTLAASAGKKGGESVPPGTATA